MEKFIKNIIKDISNICLSYLSKEESIYIKGEWNKFPESRVFNIASEKNWLDLLIWAHNNYSHHDDWFIYATAAYNGNLDIIKWLKQNGYIWNEETYAYAASGNQLEIIKWAKLNGCPWDENTCKVAA